MRKSAVTDDLYRFASPILKRNRYVVVGFEGTSAISSPPTSLSWVRTILPIIRGRVEVERDAGKRRLDLMVWHPSDHHAVIQDSWLRQRPQFCLDLSISAFYTRQLTKLAYEALREDQTQARDYCNVIANTKGPDVTELHEYGVAFWRKR